MELPHLATTSLWRSHPLPFTGIEVGNLFAQNGGEIGLENAIWGDDVLHVIDFPLFVKENPVREEEGGKKGEGCFFLFVNGFMFVFVLVFLLFIIIFVGNG